MTFSCFAAARRRVAFFEIKCCAESEELVCRRVGCKIPSPLSSPFPCTLRDDIGTCFPREWKEDLAMGTRMFLINDFFLSVLLSLSLLNWWWRLFVLVRKNVLPVIPLTVDAPILVDQFSSSEWLSSSHANGESKMDVGALSPNTIVVVSTVESCSCRCRCCRCCLDGAR